MTTNITTLAINILISESIAHRSQLGDRIKELLLEVHDNSNLDKILKGNFITLIGKCVDNPRAECRYVFYQLAQFYHQKLQNQAKIAEAA